MRIQHNIMAMNANRNLSMNNRALSKNLEKLSSGYRINRAGDDAAGLAISEKMRAQITGLDAAQKNVQDGISLVKTAEGALQEVQDMLNRMVYLAEQSANGTYDSNVDRKALQEEVTALISEIDRIGDSSNFNGTNADMGVLTHEAGHAFNAFLIADNKFALEIGCGGMETAETHSMSMEYFAWKYIHKFFGEDAKKYKYMHALENFSFIPYGTMVDAFQHIVYENPEMTPAQRNEAWLELERKFRPHIQLEGIPFIEEGRRWQYQMHIYESPFYYIDYCLAQTVALQFWAEFLKDPKDAWKRYLALVNMAGTGTFVDVVKAAGLMTPFEDGCIKDVAETAKNWCLTHQLKK